MEQFMKHFLEAMLRAKPEDIVSSFDDDMEDDCDCLLYTSDAADE